ncbi:PIG-X/PBN1 domain-containing protein [Hirsutella rhossiliensis]|uniref:Protein PBN1 n=1 Tax=Hirsutella rhossiliensis TaxID=111463 RepID=A0A9P8N5X4_9HYPO|nr:PIG-X / PBN1 domain-containing protein [Hirsutella rhossiliensis]KAH0967359.1 PIG-X / PBN1 domain-containing protein [Hirsutella rhossiliensis]
MRETVTFVYPPDGAVDPKAFHVQPAGLLGPAADVVRQDRLTVGLDQLPPDIASLLQGYHALHLTWTSPHAYDTLEPFSSRQSPGLRVFLTPSAKRAHDPVKLCEMLQIMGPLDCMTTEAWTAAHTTERGVWGPLSFYQQLEHLSASVESATRDLCPDTDSICQSRLRTLYTAASLDLSYSSTDRALWISAFWPLREHSITVLVLPGRQTEVGIFTKDSAPNLGPYGVGLHGILNVLEDQKEPSPALFIFRSRHKLYNASFASEFLRPIGVHPTLQFKLSTNKPPVQDAECAPYAYLTLPKTMFANRYHFEDKIFLASKNLSASRYTTLPVELEAPEYNIKTWGSNVLLQLAPPISSDEQIWTAQVPLHLRYLKPRASGYTQVEVPYPVVFWACQPGGDEDPASNPFDRRHLGYDELFSPGTIFWHVSPKPEVGNRVMSSITVPVLREDSAAWVRLGTTAAMVLGCAWVIWNLLVALTAPAQQDPKRKEARHRVK